MGLITKAIQVVFALRVAQLTVALWRSSSFLNSQELEGTKHCNDIIVHLSPGFGNGPRRGKGIVPPAVASRLFVMRFGNTYSTRALCLL